MATEDDLRALGLYHGLMVEAKARALSINAFTNDQRGVPSPFVREYGFLQLRMLCELIGLGCLVAHGDIEETKTKAFQKAYDPTEILKRLDELHPDFYPVPRQPIKTAKGWHFDNYAGDFLSKADLFTLYGACGDVLHRGSLKRLVSPKAPYQKDFTDLGKWGQKVLNLLSNHLITRRGGEFHFITFLDVKDAGGDVQCAIGELPES